MSGRPSARPWIPYLLGAAAALMAAIVYVNALNNPFVYDDRRVVLDNFSIRDLANIRALLLNDVFRPVVNISYALDYARSGLAPFGYHVTSVLLHVANVTLLFFLVRALAGDARAMLRLPPVSPAPDPRERRTKGPAPAPASGAEGQEAADTATAAAFAAAAVWAVHPLMTQAVGYISGRSELVCAFFVLISFLCLHAWVFRRGTRWLVLGVGSWVLALASKEVAVMLPVVLLAYGQLLLTVADREHRKRVLRVARPMLAVVLVAGLARLAVFAGVENVSRANFAWANVLVGVDVVRHYVALMFLTAPQSIFHSATLPSALLRPTVIFDVLWVLGLAVLAWRAHVRVPLVAYGVLWFVLMLLPSVTMLVLDVGEPLAEQRAYLAGCGFAMSAGAAFGRVRAWSSRHRVFARVFVTALFAFVLLGLGVRTIARNEVWSDPVLLWKEAVTHAPDIWLPRRGLGDALRERGDHAGAAAAYAEAARLGPGEANTHLALGISLLVVGRVEEADRALAEATRLSPGLPQAETARGMIARTAGRRDEARDRFLAVARAHPNAVLARQYLADMYENDYGDWASALRMCQEVQALAPQAVGVADCIRRNQRRLSEAGRGPGGA